jgi:hypothetical protein
MVYCGIYPADGAHYEDVREALGRLKLNDAALLFEPETSNALGFGFRCGFLGLLHMEVIQERLEREFDLDLVTTAPSVRYIVHTIGGEEWTIENPANLPDPSEIASMEEPMVRAHILTPTEYVGAVMELCQEKRGEFLTMDYLEPTRVQINYNMPLNEIIYDFFDAIKSRTRGYASLDYELTGYQASDLVKLDILLNGEICDALSSIVHREKAYARGRKLAEKLVEVIRGSSLRSRYRPASAARSSPGRRSAPTARTYWPSAMAVTSPARRSSWRSRRRARSACARWAAYRCLRKPLCRFCGPTGKQHELYSSAHRRRNCLYSQEGKAPVQPDVIGARTAKADEGGLEREDRIPPPLARSPSVTGLSEAKAEARARIPPSRLKPRHLPLTREAILEVSRSVARNNGDKVMT